MSEPAETKAIKALIIEDREDDALLLLTMLKRGGYQVHHRRVDTQLALDQALAQPWDIVFSDHSMPTMTGIEALARVRQQNNEVPFIFVSGTIGEDVAVESMRNGAQDYIMKDNLKRLLPAVQRELLEFENRKAQHEAEQRLHYLANFDSLTTLPNRFQFIEQLQGAIDQLGNDQFLDDPDADTQPLAVVYIDLDRFKSINDSLGYEAGNLLLQEAAQRLRGCVGASGLAARLATDEFALLLRDIGTSDEVGAFVKQVLDCLEVPYKIYGWSMYCGASLGIARYPQDAVNATELLGKADIATYRAKDQGGHGFLFYTPAMAVQLEERLALERLMREAIVKAEFELHYQPQIDLKSGRMLGVEALLRWHNQERGNISPANFIPLAEETGFILPLGEWVLQQACRQLRQWRDAGMGELRVAVNISARQFHEENLAQLVTQILRQHGLDPHCLELEITETTLMKDQARAMRTLKQIQDLGVRVALDDFGTGYSSLSYLKVFKTNYLKIDQSFIRGLPEDKDDREIVAAIIAMAEKMSLQTIAEGVETQAQYDWLHAQGCSMAQGYHISRPVPAAAIELLLTTARQAQRSG